MSSDDIYRQVTLPGPSGTGDVGNRAEPPSWSARRTVLTVVVLLLAVGGAFWWALPESSEPQRWELKGQQQLANPAAATAIDLPSTERALDALDGWEQMSWTQKREATPVIAAALGIGAIDYVVYIDANHVIIREHLELRKRDELIRRAADKGQDR